MIVLGLAGKARAGKSTVAQWLVRNCGFIEFSFSDALYREVSDAYQIDSGDDTLQRADSKERPCAGLSLLALGEPGPAAHPFIHVAMRKMGAESPKLLSPAEMWERPLSPRWILQTWGTEYRRAQDPDYWVKAASAWLNRQANMYQFPEQVPQYYVNTSVRFANEQAWIHRMGGNVWHVFRDEGRPEVQEHVSETPLPVLPGERELHNNDTIARLYSHGMLVMLKGPHRRVWVLPAGARVPEAVIDADQAQLQASLDREAELQRALQEPCNETVAAELAEDAAREAAEGAK